MLFRDISEIFRNFTGIFSHLLPSKSDEMTAETVAETGSLYMAFLSFGITTAVTACSRTDQTG